MENNKIYPKVKLDKGGKKFIFRFGDKHFTIRFSGKPMILLEKYFIYFGGDKDVFLKLWELANDKKEIPEEYNHSLTILSKSLNRIEEFNNVIDLCDEDNKSPFVVYVNDFNPYK